MEDITVFWLLTSLFFLLLEMSNPGLFFFLSFFIGGLMSLGLSFFSDSWVNQIWVFLGSTACAFLILKYWVKRTMRHPRSTNSAALVGKRGVVMKSITLHEPGSVKIGGELWSARSHQTDIAAGALVEVVQVRGAHVVVTEIVEGTLS